MYRWILHHIQNLIYMINNELEYQEEKQMDLFCG